MSENGGGVENIAGYSKAITTASLAAGAIEKTVVYPLDVLKTRFQVQTPFYSSTYCYTPYRGIFNGFRTLLRQEGIRSLYRGFFAPALSYMPQMVVRYTMSEITQLYFPFVSAALDPISPTKESKKYMALGMTGAVAGAAESFVVVPTDIVKVRLQSERRYSRKYMRRVNSADVITSSEEINSLNRKLTYESVLGTFKQVYKAGGFRDLYLGTLPTLFRQSLYGGVTFASYEYFKTLALHPRQEELVGFQKLFCGIMSGGVAAVVGSPFDVVKTRMQSVDSNYTSFVASLRRIMQEEGIKGFYKGLSVKLLRISIGTGICLVAFEEIFRNLLERLEEEVNDAE